ncbi:AAA-like domain-containing protein [Armatimonas sp.]|uniref:AAA-like domain-containing protein n=1 Tax=Armatimonas sp. TaxID=1872638 RepID=UPI00374DF78C
MIIVKLFGSFEVRMIDDGNELPDVEIASGSELMSLPYKAAMSHQHMMQLPHKEIELRFLRSDRLLAFLAIQSKPINSSIVLQEVWGDGSESTRRKGAKALNDAMGMTILESKNKTLALTHPIDCDLKHFESLIRSGDMKQVHTALALYTAPLLQGWDMQEDKWFQDRREKCKRLYLDQMCQQCRQAAARSDFSTASQLAFAATCCHPEFNQSWYHLLYAQVHQGELEIARQSAERYLRYLNQKRKEPDADIKPLMDQLQRNKQSVKPLYSIPSGPLSPEDPHYIERPADQELRRALYEGQWTILIKGPCKSGKSSLLARGLNQMRKSGQRVAFTDLATWDEDDFVDANRFCQHLGTSLLLGLQDSRRSQDVWIDDLPATEMLTYMLSDLLRQTTSGKLVWAIDGLDRVFGKPYQDTFFAQLRHWHSQHALHPVPWMNLALILVCSREAHLYIKDLNQSPFNVGVAVETQDLTHQESLRLQATYGVALPAQSQDLLFELLGGHPYLLNRTFAALVHEPLLITELLEAPLEHDRYQDHLRRLTALLTKEPALMAALAEVQRGNPCEERAFWELRSLGILAGNSSKRASFRCGLYRLMASNLVGTKDAH